MFIDGFHFISAYIAVSLFYNVFYEPLYNNVWFVLVDAIFRFAYRHPLYKRQLYRTRVLWWLIRTKIWVNTNDSPSLYGDLEFLLFQVIELPQEGPYITKTDFKSRYQLNDSVRLNCTCEKSYPAVNLTWYYDEKPVPPKYVTPKVHTLDYDYFT